MIYYVALFVMMVLMSTLVLHYHIIKHFLQRMRKLSEPIIVQRPVENNSYLCVYCEKVNNSYLLYEQGTERFIAQGTCREDVLQAVIDNHNGSQLCFATTDHLAHELFATSGEAK